MKLTPATVAEVNKMTFSLYTNSEDPKVKELAEKATKAGRELIFNLIVRLVEWEDAYAEAGASDTAAREVIALQIARTLGLRVE